MIDAPGQGTIQVEPDQKLRYTPQQGFAGSTASPTPWATGGAARPRRASRSRVASQPAAGGRARRGVDHGRHGGDHDALANDNDPDGDAIGLPA